MRRDATEDAAQDRTRTSKRILAISSAGGHWVQLMRLWPVFREHDVVYATSDAGYAVYLPPGAQLFTFREATRWNKIGLARLLLRIAWIVVRVRPNVVVTTGAAPGYFALRIGKIFRAHTVWIDSLANIEQMSMSGRLAGGCADLWLTQWPSVARGGGPFYRGSVL